MGCICSKGINKEEIVAEAISIKEESTKSISRAALQKDKAASHDVEANPVRNAVLSRTVSKARGNASVSTLKDGDKKVVPVVDRTKLNNGHQRSVTVDARPNADDVSSRVGKRDGDAEPRTAITGVPNAFSGEHVISGWPTWLTSVAAEAIKGWLPRRADSFEKLEKIGQGTYSSVYRARDLETGKIVALKKVRFVNMDPESVQFMAREIHILRILDHPNVIKLEGIVTSRMSSSLYLVFEYMEHDLAGLVATPGMKFTEPQVKCFMQQLLRGLEHCHGRRVLHRDIKGSNLLLDSNGALKIGDFGLGTVFNPEKRKPLTSRVVTLWYRPPELLLGATEYDVAVDLWSAGCILAELLSGKPIMPGRTEVEQLHKIFKLCGSPKDDYWDNPKLSQSTIFRPQHRYPRRIAETFRDFPLSALKLLDTLLALQPEDRGTAASALQSEFFTTKPFACDPSSLPKYPPSKEYDARLRDEEARRQREAATKHRGTEAGTRATREPKTTQHNRAEAKKRVANNGQKFNPMEDGGAGFCIEPPSGDHGYPRVGSTMHPGAYGNLRIRDADHPDHGPNTVTAGPQLRIQRSYMPKYMESGDLPGFAGMSRKPTTAIRALDMSASTQNIDKKEAKDSKAVFGNKNKKGHCSGPLMRPGGNMDDMLKEHERQIQEAVRKARIHEQGKR